jgi:hypothetical protein
MLELTLEIETSAPKRFRIKPLVLNTTKITFQILHFTINQQIKILQPSFEATTTVSILFYSYEKDERDKPGKLHNNRPHLPLP